MKKICIISPCALPIPTTKGGAVETLAEYMLDENEVSHKYLFTVITVKEEQAVKMSKKYKYTKFVFIEKKSLLLIDKAWNILYRLLKKIKLYIPYSRMSVQVLKILSSLEKQDLYLYLAGVTTQIPWIAHVVGKDRLLVHLHWDGMGTPRYAKNCKQVIAISEYIAQQWRQQAKSEAVTVVKNCVKVDTFSKTVSEEEKFDLRQQLDIGKDDRVVLFVGRIVEEKGLRELIQAFEAVKQDNVVLLIIGSANFGAKTNTKYEREVAAMIGSSKKKIKFTGYIHQTELYKYYALADFSVMPSQFQEPAGLVAIEAQVTGTPLIITRVGGLEEYSSPDSSISIVKDKHQVQHLTEAIECLLNDQERCKIMGENARKFALQFNSKVYFEDFSHVFDSAIGKIY